MRYRTRGYRESYKGGGGGRGPKLPEGIYEARLEDVREGRSQSGNDVLRVDLSVHDGRETVAMKATIPMSWEPRVANFFEALCNESDPPEFEDAHDMANALCGRHCRVEIVHQPGTRNPNVMFANVDRFLPLEERGHRSEGRGRGHDSYRRDRDGRGRDPHGAQTYGRGSDQRDSRDLPF